ncbi:alpha/beta fold hydrolase [Stigmatella sp. ncwal1]|uniref:Alpha/beta fold hydrolase n=1 Tax=Stigmatella ashevillensis TaxID=2995309 RepID=A0ABT5D958_9BACT|nr:alpha/beta fold hydrolase [Stigmatella ashevillena]MDC0710212.1 alpha/beta fold hydrolase [Stigmatella ashevillena]
MRFNVAVTLVLALLLSSTGALAGSKRSTYILVHGAFHGGWAWQAFAEELRQDKATVYTPTLTGLGERAHLAQPDVSLETHVQDIVSLILFEDLHDVVLVGHSYAGMVITGVAAALPDRIDQLVYFDAAIPEPGQSFFAAVGFPDAFPADMWQLPPFSPQDFGVTRPEEVAFVGARLRPQPLATFQEPIAFDWKTLSKIRKTYIHCKGAWFQREIFLGFRAKALARGWKHEDINASHDAMLTDTKKAYKALRDLVD